MRVWLPVALLVFPAIALGGDEPVSKTPPVASADAGQPDNTSKSQKAATPQEPALIAPAPAPLPAPPEGSGAQPPQAGQAQPAPTPPGQWVYTDQYGWLWMPYDNAFSYLPPGGATPNMYVYYPSVGWTWVMAPWLWGYGPMPYFGVYGTTGFGWWGVGLGAWYGYAWPYAGWYGGYGWGYTTGNHWVGYHPAAPRVGAVPPAAGTRGGFVAPHFHVGGRH